MKIKSLLFISLLFWSLSNQAQDHVDLNIQSKDTASLNIIRVYPDDFPKVSIVFNAETNKGEPIWDLSRQQVQIFEGTSPCPIHCLKRISENESVKIGLVVDHSGSMAEDYSQLFNKKGKFIGKYNKYGGIILPKGYISPIDNAKKAVKGFVASMNNDKDSIQVIGFSEKVDKVIPFSNDRALINKQIAAMQPTSLTAFYDAVKVSLEQIKEEKGIKVVIALSDGGDNKSTSNIEEVIALAKALDVPIYTVALGNANKEALSRMSEETGGSFYYTKSSNALSEIYDNIAKKIRSIYELGYSSENLASEAKRDFKLVFNIDSIYLSNNEISLNLPESVVEHLKQKEKEAEQQLYVYSGMGIALILLAGSLVFLFRKRQSEDPKNKASILLKTYPNPFKETLIVNYKIKGTNPVLNLTSLNGSVILTRPLNPSSTSVQLRPYNLEKGTYVLTLVSDAGISNPLSVVRG
jgi:Ca-activated chloride channel family protein